MKDMRRGQIMQTKVLGVGTYALDTRAGLYNVII